LTANTLLSPKHGFIGDIDAGTSMGIDEPALLRLGSEKRSEVEPGDLSGKSRPSRPCERPSAKPSVNPICVAHAKFVAALAEHSPRPIPIDADAIDLEDRADHLGKVFSALSAYVAVVLDDTAQNVPGRLDLRDAEAILADLASDVTGTIQRAADDMAGRVA
jgi:hypothetical protein